MSDFKIDFFELAFLAEACIPPRPIARIMFWQNLTDKYYSEMTLDESAHLFDWIMKCEHDLFNEDFLVWHNRFNPNNQFLIHCKYENRNSFERAFLHNGKYHIKRNTFIDEKYIIKVEKL